MSNLGSDANTAPPPIYTLDARRVSVVHIRFRFFDVSYFGNRMKDAASPPMPFA